MITHQVKFKKKWGNKVMESLRWVFTDALTPLSASTQQDARTDEGENQVNATRTPTCIQDRNGSSCGISDAEVEALLESRTNKVSQNHGFSRTRVPAAVEQAHIQRKRKVKALSEARKRGRRMKMGARATKEPKVDPNQRVSEFPGHSLRVSNGSLYCDACVTQVSLRKCSVNQHCQGKNHLEAIVAWEKRNVAAQQTIELLERQRKENPNEKGGCLSADVQSFRFKTARTLLRCGIPFNKVEIGLASLLEHSSGHKIGHSSDLRDYIPLVWKQETELLKSELKEEFFTVVFDGTTRIGEVMAVVVRYCTADFRIQYRLIRLSTTAKHMSGVELSGMLLRTLVQRLGENVFDSVLAAARDSCATNGVALRSMKQCAMPELTDILCFSHTLHNCAKHMQMNTLDEWLTPWFQLMAHSHRAKKLWNDLVGESPKLFSKVRWWSRMECASQIAKFFHHMDTFVQTLEKESVGDATTAALRKILSSKDATAALRLDLAIVLDTAIFCEKTYRLEGDRLESLLLYEEIEAIREKGKTIGMSMRTLPNVTAVLKADAALEVGTPVMDWFGAPYNAFYKGKVASVPRDLEDGVHLLKFSDGSEVEYHREEARAAIDVTSHPSWQHAVEVVNRAAAYLEKRLTDDPSVEEPYRLKQVYALFKAVRVFDPLFAIKGGVTSEAIQALQQMSWISGDHIQKLEDELPEYVAAAKQMDEAKFSHNSVSDFTEATLTFWRQLSEVKCPTWKKEARKVFCLTPNSAASERVFSLLSSMLDQQQELALTDFIECSIMLAYNKRDM